MMTDEERRAFLEVLADSLERPIYALALANKRGLNALTEEEKLRECASDLRRKKRALRERS